METAMKNIWAEIKMLKSGKPTSKAAKKDWE